MLAIVRMLAQHGSAHAQVAARIFCYICADLEPATGAAAADRAELQELLERAAPGAPLTTWAAEGASLSFDALAAELRAIEGRFMRTGRWTISSVA